LMLMPRRGGRRGYPLAVLIGLEGGQAFVWSVFSESVKPGERVLGDNEYNFYESVVDMLRPFIRQGVKSVLIAAPDEKDYKRFMNHVSEHQGWLLNGGLNSVVFEHLPKPAMNADQVRGLVKSHGFREKLSEVYEGDIRQVMGALEKHLNDPEGIETLLFTLREAEDALYRDEKNPRYILVTEHFRSQNRQRTDRLLQVAANKGVKTRIIKPNTPTGGRIAQFGGLICLLSE
jgi:stalled ribosome rescue protein Dom34